MPEVQVLDLPFLSGSARQAYCVIDSELDGYLRRKAADKGLIVLSWMSNGARHVTNGVRPIRKLEDIKGLKIRTPPSDVYLETFKLLGANAVSLDIKELYQALQQRVVDGQENPYGNILVRNFNEVQPYLSNTGHFFAYAWLVVNKAKYDSLKKEHKAALHEAAFRATAAQRAMMDRENEGARAELVKRGMKFDQLPAGELVRFRQAVASVYESLRKTIGGEVIDLALKVAKACPV